MTGNGQRHRFRVSVERIEGAGVAEFCPPVTFEVRNHDDILDIMEAVKLSAFLPSDDANALALGVKLFTEVMLGHRDDELFAAMQPAMRSFILSLKARVKERRANQF